MTTWIIIALLLLLMGLLVLAFVVTQIENHQARNNKAYTSARTAQSSRPTMPRRKNFDLGF